MAALLYLAAFPFDVGGLICILLYQFLIRSLIYFTTLHATESFSISYICCAIVLVKPSQTE